MSRIFFICCILIVLAGFSCHDDGTEPPNSDLQLIAEDVGVTEVWLRVKVAPSIKPRTLTITRDNAPLLSAQLTSPDTLLYDASLLPRHTYNYKATLTNAFPLPPLTVSVAVTTLDTTSHDFAFEIDSLGDGASSNLKDVFIINDTLAYAVGEVYKLDSTGNFSYPAYNLAKWNGKEWTLECVSVMTRFGLITPALDGIFAFSPTDIWLMSTDPIHGDGVTWRDYDIRILLGLDTVSVSKAWGTSSSNMYFVGRHGTIVSFDGNLWQRIESGTTLPIQDLWGGADKSTDQDQILAVCTRNYPPAREILRIQDNMATQLPTNPVQYELFSEWFLPNRHYYVVGDGIYEKKSLGDSIWQNGPLDITRYASTSIRGNGLNDVFVVGAFGEVLHFNGLTWKSYKDQTGLTNGSYVSVAVRGSLIIAVGQNYDKAAVAIMRRR